MAVNWNDYELVQLWHVELLCETEAEKERAKRFLTIKDPLPLFRSFPTRD